MVKRNYKGMANTNTADIFGDVTEPGSTVIDHEDKIEVITTVSQHASLVSKGHSRV